MSKRSERTTGHCAFHEAIGNVPPANAADRCEVTE